MGDDLVRADGPWLPLGFAPEQLALLAALDPDLVAAALRNSSLVEELCRVVRATGCRQTLLERGPFAHIELGRHDGPKELVDDLLHGGCTVSDSTAEMILGKVQLPNRGPHAEWFGPRPMKLCRHHGKVALYEATKEELRLIDWRGGLESTLYAVGGIALPPEIGPLLCLDHGKIGGHDHSRVVLSESIPHPFILGCGHIFKVNGGLLGQTFPDNPEYGEGGTLVFGRLALDWSPIATVTLGQYPTVPELIAALCASGRTVTPSAMAVLESEKFSCQQWRSDLPLYSASPASLCLWSEERYGGRTNPHDRIKTMGGVKLPLEAAALLCLQPVNPTHRAVYTGVVTIGNDHLRLCVSGGTLDALPSHKEPEDREYVFGRKAEVVATS